MEIAKKPKKYNREVSIFLDKHRHPQADVVDKLRIIILKADSLLEENIKWNGPNYSIEGKDMITMRLFPPKKFQLVFHRGAKVQADLADRLIEDNTGLLVWKSNDRAVIDIFALTQFESHEKDIEKIVKKWIKANQNI